MLRDLGPGVGRSAQSHEICGVQVGSVWDLDVVVWAFVDTVQVTWI